MRTLFKFFVTISLILFSLHSEAQEVATIKLPTGEYLTEQVFDSENGLWLISSRRTMPIQGLKNTITKLSPSLEKEWDIEFKSGEGHWVYDAENPRDLYLIHEKLGAAPFGKGKVYLTRIDLEGKKQEVQMKGADYVEGELAAFLMEEKVYHIKQKLNKKGLKTTLYIFDAASLEYETKTFYMQKPHKKNTGWIYCGRKGSELLYVNYLDRVHWKNKRKDPGKYQICTVDVLSGKVSEVRDIQPDLGGPRIAPVRFDRLEKGEYGHGYSFQVGRTGRIDDAVPNPYAPAPFLEPTSRNSTHLGQTKHGNLSVQYSPSAFGNFMPAEQEGEYYFYSLINYSDKKTVSSSDLKPEGILLQKIDRTGKALWTADMKIKKQADLQKIQGAMASAVSLSCLPTGTDGERILVLTYLESTMKSGKAPRECVTIGWKANKDGFSEELCRQLPSCRRLGRASST